MLDWKNSVYSDGTDCFVSNPTPKLNETIQIKIRLYDNSPVNDVFLRRFENGAERVHKMNLETIENGFRYYSVDLKINEPFIPYHFYLVTDDKIYFYNQKELTDFFPDRVYDFKIVADYDQPKWVKESVFYQIFPDRFCNGNPENDIQYGEITEDGHKSFKYKNWNDIPVDYDKGHCLDFYGGDLEGIAQKIPYLKELGVTALYLNPIFLAPSSHKYDCIDYFKVDEHFGGDKALAELSEKCHENGIRLILDVSINHTGAHHIWFNRDGIFYDKSKGAYNNKDSIERSYYFFNDKTNDYKGWWDLTSMPTLNYTSDNLRKTVYRDKNSLVKKWLNEPYNIDGWRFDVADVFCRNDNIQLNHEVWPEIRDSIKEENPEAYILAEDWDDCSANLQGDEWDSAMNYYGCARVLRHYVGAPELFLERNELYNHPMKITANNVRQRITDFLAKLPFVINENQFNLIDSHDVSRLHNHETVNKDDYKGAVILQFMLIGAPSIYYGDEAEIEGRIDSNEGCRYPMPWDKQFENTDTFKLYQKLAHLKTSTDALRKGGMKFIYSDDNVLALARLYKNNIIVAISSTSDEDKMIELDIGQLGSKQPVSQTDLLGQEVDCAVMEPGLIQIKLPAHQSYILDCSY